MKFSIVTASFRQRDWLKRCVRSVADQGVAVEHIVQDAGTGPALEAWVRGRPGMRLFVEKDAGIYDALNRGFARATGEILAFLNCDEQYLPGALRRVEKVFAQSPEVDFVTGDFLILDGKNQLLSFRRATPQRPAMILTDHLYNFTCAMAFRRSVWERTGPFDAGFRAAGDAEWVARALRRGAQVAVVRRYQAAFFLTGENLSLRADEAEEEKRLRAVTPTWARLAAPVLRRIRHFEKWKADGYRSGPIEYEIFAGPEDEVRSRFVCERPQWRHPWAR